MNDQDGRRRIVLKLERRTLPGGGRRLRQQRRQRGQSMQRRGIRARSDPGALCASNKQVSADGLKLCDPLPMCHM